MFFFIISLFFYIYCFLLKDISVNPDKKCKECAATLVHVEFNKNDTPLQGGATEYEGCILCDDLLNELLHTELSKKVHPMFSRRGRGRGRGKKRGRKGGRGRGR